MVLNQLHANEQGTYRCSLQDRNATVFSTVTFLLTGKVKCGGSVFKVFLSHTTLNGTPVFMFSGCLYLVEPIPNQD